MDQAQKILNEALAPRFDYQIGNVYFSPSYFHAGAIVLLLFLLILSFARLRRLYLHWSLKGAASMITLGFIFAIIIEGFFILWVKPLVTELLGWKNPPKPIGRALDVSKDKLVDVLGETDEVSQTKAETIEATYLIDLYQQLPPEERNKLINTICKP